MMLLRILWKIRIKTMHFFIDEKGEKTLKSKSVSEIYTNYLKTYIQN
jgi:hypothetical protein